MSARIVAYSYVDSLATATGLPHPRHNATATIGVIEQATPLVTTWARPTAPAPFLSATPGEGQIDKWAAALTANTPAGTYSVTYSPTTQRLTIASDVAFQPAFPTFAHTEVWAGFGDAIVGWATSWTGTTSPAAVAELLAATVEPAEDMARVELHEYRHGRAAAIAWGNHQVHRVALVFKSENLHIFDPGYLTTGRVRIYQGADDTAYSPTNVDGYVDGYVIASTDPTEDGDVGELWTLNLLVGVARV